MVLTDLFADADGSPGYEGPSPEKFDLDISSGLQDIEKQDGELFVMDTGNDAEMNKSKYKSLAISHLEYRYLVYEAAIRKSKSEFMKHTGIKRSKLNVLHSLFVHDKANQLDYLSPYNDTTRYLGYVVEESDYWAPGEVQERWGEFKHVAEKALSIMEGDLQKLSTLQGSPIFSPTEEETAERERKLAENFSNLALGRLRDYVQLSMYQVRNLMGCLCSKQNAENQALFNFQAGLRHMEQLPHFIFDDRSSSPLFQVPLMSAYKASRVKEFLTKTLESALVEADAHDHAGAPGGLRDSLASLLIGVFGDWTKNDRGVKLAATSIRFESAVMLATHRAFTTAGATGKAVVDVAKWLDEINNIADTEVPKKEGRDSYRNSAISIFQFKNYPTNSEARKELVRRYRMQVGKWLREMEKHGQALAVYKAELADQPATRLDPQVLEACAYCCRKMGSIRDREDKDELPPTKALQEEIHRYQEESLQYYGRLEELNHKKYNTIAQYHIANILYKQYRYKDALQAVSSLLTSLAKQEVDARKGNVDVRKIQSQQKQSAMLMLNAHYLATKCYISIEEYKKAAEVCEKGMRSQKSVEQMYFIYFLGVIKFRIASNNTIAPNGESTYTPI